MITQTKEHIILVIYVTDLKKKIALKLVLHAIYIHKSTNQIIYENNYFLKKYFSENFQKKIKTFRIFFLFFSDNFFNYFFLQFFLEILQEILLIILSKIWKVFSGQWSVWVTFYSGIRTHVHPQFSKWLNALYR